MAGPKFQVMAQRDAAVRAPTFHPSTGSLRSVVQVRCDPSWDAVRELSEYVTRYVSRRLASSPAERARLVISELLDAAAAAARGDSTLEYELQLRPGDFSTFVTSIAIDTVPERARLIATRVHKLMQLPAGEACKTVLSAIALGKEDENCLPFARIRSEGMLLDCTENGGDLRIAASTPGSATG